MRLVSTNSIYDVADGVRKRIIRPVEGQRLHTTLSSDRRNRNLHGCRQQDGKLHTGNGLRQHAPHHLEEPVPDAGQPAV